jgi:hypothetical protein
MWDLHIEGIGTYQTHVKSRENPIVYFRMLVYQVGKMTIHRVVKIFRYIGPLSDKREPNKKKA